MPIFRVKTPLLPEQFQGIRALFNLTRFDPFTEDFFEGFLPESTELPDTGKQTVDYLWAMTSSVAHFSVVKIASFSFFTGIIFGTPYIGVNQGARPVGLEKAVFPLLNHLRFRRLNDFSAR